MAYFHRHLPPGAIPPCLQATQWHLIRTKRGEGGCKDFYSIFLMVYESMKGSVDREPPSKSRKPTFRYKISDKFWLSESEQTCHSASRH